MSNEGKKARKDSDLIKTFKRVFENEDGQEVLFYLQKHFHFMSTVYDTEPYRMALKEGERNVVLYIMALLDMNPAEVIKKYRRQREKESQYEEYNFE